MMWMTIETFAYRHLGSDHFLHHKNPVWMAEDLDEADTYTIAGVKK